MNNYYDFGNFSVADFSPVKIKAPEVPLDEMSEIKLRNYLVQLRTDCAMERFWQKHNGIVDEDRLVQLAEMYQEAQTYLAQYDESLRSRIESADYKPVLRLNGKQW
jgi:hypothetical protein